MGDNNDTDAFDFPTSGQSGNVDIGHISRDQDAEVQRLRGEQSELLTNALNEYYSHDTDFNTLYSNLDELGYSEDQINEISAGAHAERVYRMGHPDVAGGSGLTLNQLAYLQRSTGFQMDRTTIRQDYSAEPPLTFVDDYRTRDDDGLPARLYLPAPIQFEPLTADQQSEIRIDERVLSYITLQEPEPTGQLLQDNIDLQTRHAVSQLITQYLSRTSEEGNDQRREKLYRDIQALDGLQNQRNIRPKLLELFRDIAVEQQFRLMNNGRPRGVTVEQWETIQRSPFYYGQPILLTDTDPPIRYIVSGSRYIEISDTGLEIPARERVMTMDDLSGDTQNQLNLLSTEFLTNQQEDPEVFSQNILSAINYDPDDPGQLRIRLQTEDLVNQFNQERIFRSQNDGRPSDLSALQYEFMLNHTLAENEPRYTGEPIEQTTLAGGRTAYGFHSWDSNIPQLILIPRDDDIADMITAGFYTRPTPEEEPEPDIDPDENLRPQRRPQIPEGGLPPLPTPPTVIPPVRPISEFLPRPEEPTADPQFTLPPDTPVIPTTDLDDQVGPRASGLGDPRDIPPLPAGGRAPTGFEPPIVAGQQTQPINLRTGEDLPADTLSSNILRYQQYFNDNQSLYYGFREAFRDILPVITAGAGGYITYLYKSSRNKNTIQTIISEEQILLDELEGRIRSEEREVRNILNSLLNTQQLEGARLEAEAEEQGVGDIFFKKIRDIPEEITRQREIIEMERLTLPPERAFALRGTPVYQFNEPERFALQQRIETLDGIQRLIDQQQITIDRLQTDIAETQVYTTQIDTDIRTLQNTNYEILSEVIAYSPQILTGVSVGYTLGLFLSGYIYPTYMNINEPYITAENIEYDNKDRRSEKTKNLKNPHEEEPRQSIAFKREYDEKPSRIVKPFQEKFRPVKHGKRPLKYKEIQELKSTLSPAELNNLKNKYLYFDDDKLNIEKTTDKCLNVIQETQIPKRKVF